jgi:hypothetical protein
MPSYYEHYINGVKQDGFYLGHRCTTCGPPTVITWAFKYVDASFSWLGNPYYSVRVLAGASPRIQPGEFMGFLKVMAF